MDAHGSHSAEPLSVPQSFLCRPVCAWHGNGLCRTFYVTLTTWAGTLQRAVTQKREYFTLETFHLCIKSHTSVIVEFCHCVCVRSNICGTFVDCCLQFTYCPPVQFNTIKRLYSQLLGVKCMMQHVFGHCSNILVKTFAEVLVLRFDLCVFYSHLQAAVMSGSESS